jgi:outer membrane protein OmpA-like peptidoglycan-associated protein
MYKNQFRKNHFRLLSWLAFVMMVPLSVIGCTTATTLKPTSDILKNAEQSFAAAESAESVRYAPDDFLLAKSALGEAKAALKDSDSTDNQELKESKRKGARRSAYEAWLRAEIAISKAREEKAKEQTKQLRLETAQLQADRQRYEAELQVAHEKKATEEAEIGKSLALKEAEAAQNRAALEKAVKELAIKAQLEAETRAARESAAKDRALQSKQDLEVKLVIATQEVAKVREDKRGLIVSLSDILFEIGQPKLAPGARDNLVKVGSILTAYPDRQISIEGHTDSVGSDESNQQLSEARAQTVRKTLIEAGVKADRVKAAGFGKSKPIASNSTPQGRQQNRRVEVVVLNPPSQSGSPLQESPATEEQPATTSPGETQP